MPELLQVQIRLRKWKRVLNQFYPRFCVCSDDNFHYVETEKYIRIFEHTQPCERAARYSLLFFPVYRFQWPAEIFARPRFYFDKHQRVVVATHHVDLAATASAEIAEKNLVAATLQEPAR